MSYAIRNDGLGWRAVDSADDCSADETYSEQEPTPAPMTLDDLKAGKLVEINNQCGKLLAAVIVGYPDAEVQSWSKQEAEARAYVADNFAKTPFLTALATAREMPIDDLATKVIEKADLIAVASGQIIGRRQRCMDLIQAAVNAVDLDAINW